MAKLATYFSRDNITFGKSFSSNIWHKSTDKIFIRLHTFILSEMQKLVESTKLLKMLCDLMAGKSSSLNESSKKQ